ncbi:MAG: isoleucine--tRNA ligase [Pirellulales bacterium]|nr:isoleucine--tRNA ligase [Pirellulales bacterium]
MFETVEGSVDFPALEEQIGRFWKSEKIYEKSLVAREGAERFVFYEGPPTANGMPHPGHCLTRAIKDLFPRYRTMQGFLCERKAGWDTHGLPVEVEVCKELGIHSKEEIEAYGIEPFIQQCQASVWRYMQEWERLTERLGFWVDLRDAYVTYHQSYVESVWWSLQQLFERGLLYRGHKIVWWWAQGGTALSAGEVGQGYREVADPSAFLKLPLKDERYPETSLLVWTTTPWTLPSNQFAAVHPEIEYAQVRDVASGEALILARDLVDPLAEQWKREWVIEASCQGDALVGLRYQPPFNCFSECGGEASWKVVPAEFVTTESGTGLVHIAPAFGEDDYNILQRERAEDPQVPLIHCVGPDGKFTDQAPEFVQGRWVKECDKDIVRDLKSRQLLVHQSQYLHDYPFCWRAEEDPLIQYPRESWFIKTTLCKDAMLENNRAIQWLPDHIQEGRMGKFLESNVDWALSRERYWGTPLPIWECSQTGKQEAISSYAELQSKPGVTGFEVWEAAKAASPNLPDDLRVHKPYIDAVTYESPFAEGSRMQRVSEVIDCWYDSGAMPFAQWGYPHQGTEHFSSQFPADFISEALDQTRGWFYSLLAISTLLSTTESEDETEANLFDRPLPHPFRNCIVLGLMLGEDGGKMSKSKRNYREPNEIFDKYGADALRWYFFANQPPWTSIRYNEQSIKESIPEFLLRLWNVYSFFVIYAKIDGFNPAEGFADSAVDASLTPSTLANVPGYPATESRSELDRWILSQLHRTSGEVTAAMDRYENYEACGHLTTFVDALSNWYVRRSRDRFWSGETRSADKWNAYWTLYECLLTTSKLVAPFIPFLAESIWKNLARPFESIAHESVHLCDYPIADPACIDTTLLERMALMREIASLGRSARMEAKQKVRQPLPRVEVILTSPTHLDWLASHAELIRTELNVKEVELTLEAPEYITYQIQPDFKRLGPKMGPLMPKLKQALQQANGRDVLAQLAEKGCFELDLEGESIQLGREDLQVRLQAKEGWAASEGAQCVVVLSTELTEELIGEGMVRDLVRVVQDRRKELGCDFTDRIALGIVTESIPLQAAIKSHEGYLAAETLSQAVSHTPITEVSGVDIQLGEHELTLYVEVADS